MLVGVINAHTMEQLDEVVNGLPPHVYDLLEFRLDSCLHIDLTVLGKILMTTPLPVIFTLRPTSQGGCYEGPEEERLAILTQLAALGPHYMDIEYSVDPHWIYALRKEHPSLQLILSYHNFDETPHPLTDILDHMRAITPARFYKIATYGRTTIDALRMLCFSKTYGDKGDVVAICMGADGISTRILAPVVGGGLSYCNVLTPSAPGQLSAEVLLKTYNFNRLGPQTKIYGLIGDPVSPSRGHIFHNQQMLQRHQNAVYVKWRLQPGELDSAVPLLKQLGISGLSVTMPLKEHILPYIEEVDADIATIGAANTIVLKDHRWTGFNTDGVGAFNALEDVLGKNLHGKTVVLLGAGGAARSILYSAMKKGANTNFKRF